MDRDGSLNFGSGRHITANLDDICLLMLVIVALNVDGTGENLYKCIETSHSKA